MENVIMKIEGNTLTITVDLSKNLGSSKTGKSTIIATSAGIQPIPGATNGAKIGLNIFK